MRKLEVPEWLEQLAVRDDPPTTIDPTTISRLVAAGVEEITATNHTESLEHGQEERATGIGAKGHGFGFCESFEDESAPVAGALSRLLHFVENFDQLRRLRIAAEDMRMVETTARQLRNRQSSARVYERMLNTAIVVTYARPYLQRSRAGVGRKWWPKAPEDLKLHKRIIDDLRNPYHAHVDRTATRTIIDTTAYLGVEGPPTFAEAWWSLTDEELDAIAVLAEKQAIRLEDAAHVVGAELGEKRDSPKRSNW